MLSIDDYRQILHEVKNTICLINCSLQFIQKQHPEVEDFAYWSDVISDVDALKSITSEISAFKQGKHLELKPVDVTEFWNTTLHNILPGLHGNVHCTLEIENGLPPAYMDTFYMKQVINNLLKNAYEAIEGEGTILIKVYQEDQSIVFSITDSGCGMNEETLASVFHPFFSKKESGYGLGLSFALATIEAHGGTITCDSKLGKGTCFTIRLPQKDSCCNTTETEKADLTFEEA